MKSVLEITQLITRQKIKKIEVITEDILSSKHSKFKELYDGLKDGSIRNDRDAAQIIYQAEPTDSRYRQLKSRFKKRIMNTLFFVDQSQPFQTAYEKTLHHCHRDWSLVNILRENDAEQSAYYLAKSLLTTCLKYGFNDLILQVARYLADHASLAGDKKNCLVYNDLISEAQKGLMLEVASSNLLRNARLVCNNNDKEDPNTSVEIKKIETSLQEIEQAEISSLVFYDLMEIRCLISRFYNDVQNTISLVDEALKYGIENPKQAQKKRNLKFLNWQLACFIQQREWTKGKQCYQSIAESTKEWTTEWFDIVKGFIALCIRCDKLDQALDVYDRLASNRKFDKLPKKDKHSYHILKMIAICKVVAKDKSAFTRFKTEIDNFEKSDLNYGKDGYRLNAWRLLTLASLQFLQSEWETLAYTIAEFRQLSVKKLQADCDKRLISSAQLLYRMERNQFNFTVDRVADRYKNLLFTESYQCSLSIKDFAPVDETDMLTFFGIND